MSAPESLVSMATDPLRFVALCWPDMKLSQKQQEVLLSLVDNFETFVPAANQLGKTRIAAIGGLWFFTSRTPARVIASSSGELQLARIFWSELLQLIRTSRIPMPLVCRTLRIEKLAAPNSQETLPQDYLLGHVTNAVESFQGHHLPHDKPRVLAIFDEASGVPDEFYEASQSWAHRMLVIGNPLSNTNFFYRHCKPGDASDPAGEAKLLRKVIPMSAFDSPNVQAGMRWKEMGQNGSPPEIMPGLLSYAEYLRRMELWDEVQRTTRLLGQFYEGDQLRLFPDDWLDRAMDRRRWEQLADTDRTAEALGVDVAAGGRDKTCWTLVDRHGVIDQIVADLSNTMEIVGHTIQLINQHGISACRVAIDAGGGGKQLSDRIIEEGYDVTVVGFGGAAEAKQSYKNRRAELYGELRQQLMPDGERDTFVLPPEARQLRQELAVLPLTYDSDGRLVLLRKDRAVGQPSIQQLLKRSPDRADSLALAVCALNQYVWDGTTDDFQYCSGDPADNQPMTQAEIDELPDFLRELVESSRDWRFDDDRDQDGDHIWRHIPGDFW